MPAGSARAAAASAAESAAAGAAAGANDIFQLFTGEKARGVLAGAGAAVVANLLFTGMTLLGVPSAAAVVLCQQILGNLAAFTLDIIVAKRVFNGVPLDYTALGPRLAYLARAFFHPTFFRFVLAVTIDTLIVYQLYKLGQRELDKHKVRFRGRDGILAVLVVGLTYVLYNAILRFDWVYVDADTPAMNVVVIAWLGLTLLVSAVASNMLGRFEEDVAPKSPNGAPPSPKPVPKPVARPAASPPAAPDAQLGGWLSI
jgi:hypothetical protein